MDFEQIFENNKHRQYNSGILNYQNREYRNHSHQGYDKYFRQKAFMRQIISNPKFRIVILTGFLIVLGIFIALLSLLFPLIKNFADFIFENGISGLLEEAGNLLDKIWNGNK